MAKFVQATAILVAWALALACSTEPIEDDGNRKKGDPQPHPPHGCAANPLPGPIEAGRWSDRFFAPGLGGIDGYGPRVHDLALDPEGRLVAVGYFSFADTQPIPAAARWTGSAWEPLVPGWEDVPPHFTAVAIREDGAIALATHHALEWVGELILVRDGQAESIGAFVGAIRKLHWQGDRLWVAGLFEMGDGPRHLALWEDDTWKEAPLGSPDGAVFDILEEDGTLVVAGAFQTIGGIEADKLAAWDGATWTAHDVPIPGWIYTLVRDADGAWVVGGSLAMGDEPTHGGVARRNAEGSWELLGGGFNSGWFPGVVTALAVHEGALYAAGCFREDAAGEPIPPLVRWDGEAWVPATELYQPIRPWYDPISCGDEGPQSFFRTVYQRMLSVGDRLYLGGAFAGVGDTPALDIAVLHDGAWKPLGSDAGSPVMGWFTRMETGGPDCTLYAAGPISHLGTEPFHAALVRWKERWEPFGPPVPEGLQCLAHAVSSDERVLVACHEFDEEFGEAGAAHLFELTAEQWIPVAELGDGVFVFDMEFDAADALWIGGGSMEGSYLARWDGERIEVIESGFDAPISLLAVEPGDPEPDVVVAGYFLHRGDESMESVARFDGSTWHPMGQGIGPASALAWGPTGLYMASEGGLWSLGASPAAEEMPRSFVLAQWSGSEWEEIGTVENGLPPVDAEGAPHTFRKLVPTRDGLVAVGEVWDGTTAVHAMYWNGERFVPIGGGVGAIAVDTAAATPAGLFFGGLVATVDPAGATQPSVGAALYEWR